jgi:hypothetical protein
MPDIGRASCSARRAGHRRHTACLTEEGVSPKRRKRPCRKHRHFIQSTKPKSQITNAFITTIARALRVAIYRRTNVDRAREVIGSAKTAIGSTSRADRAERQHHVSAAVTLQTEPRDALKLLAEGPRPSSTRPDFCFSCCSVALCNCSVEQKAVEIQSIKTPG